MGGGLIRMRFNPCRMRGFICRISRRHFARRMLQNAKRYKANAAAYDAKLVALDSRHSCCGRPQFRQDKRTVITSHDAFGYLAHEYGLMFHAPEGISTDSEARRRMSRG